MEDLPKLNYVFYNVGQTGSGINVNVGSKVTKIPAYLFCPYESSGTPNIVNVELGEELFLDLKKNV